MNKILKLVAGMLLCVMLMTSCGQPTNTPADSTYPGSDALTETSYGGVNIGMDVNIGHGITSGDGMLHIIENGITEYSIIRPDSTDNMTTDQVAKLRRVIEEKTGVSPKLTTDWSKPGQATQTDAPEILLGNTNRAESAEAISKLDGNSGSVTIINNKIVIVASNSVVLRIMTDWFIETFVENPELAGNGYLKIPADTNELMTPEEISPSYLISTEGENSVTMTHCCDVGTTNGYSVLQGGCTDGKYVYIVLENQSYSPSKCIIRKYDPQTWKSLGDSEPLDIDHGNDLAYNSKTGMLIAVHNAPNRNKISFIDPDTMKVTETKTIPYEIYSITYNAAEDKYALGLSYGFNYVFVDSEFNYIGKRVNIGIITDYTKQGMDSDSNYVYFVQSGKNCIVVYDWSGNYIKTIMISGINDETEAILHIGESFYITFNVDYKTHGTIYRADIN